MNRKTKSEWVFVIWLGRFAFVAALDYKENKRKVTKVNIEGQNKIEILLTEIVKIMKSKTRKGETCFMV